MKSILLSTASGWFLRALAIAVNLVGLPLALQSLGPTKFGVMLIAFGIGSLAGIGNVGIGRTVGIAVARFFKKSPRFIAQVVSYSALRAAIFHVLFFGVCAGILLALASHIDLGPGAAEFRSDFFASAIAIFFITNLWFALSVFEGVDAGQHRLARLYCFQILGYAIALGFLMTAFRHAPSIFFATLLLNSGYVLGSAMHAIDVWLRHRYLFRPTTTKCPRLLVRSLLRGSADFAAIGLVISITFQFTTGIFGLLVGADAIVDFGVFMRIMASFGGVVFTVTTPLSNLIAARMSVGNDRGAAHAAVVTGLGLLAGCAMAAAGFDAFGEQLITLWLKTAISYEPLFRTMASLLIFFAGLYAYATAVAIGFGGVKRVARIHRMAGAVFLPLSYGCYVMWGQAGILMAMNMTLAFIAVVSFAATFQLISLRRVLTFGTKSVLAPRG